MGVFATKGRVGREGKGYARLYFIEEIHDDDDDNLPNKLVMLNFSQIYYHYYYQKHKLTKYFNNVKKLIERES